MPIIEINSKHPPFLQEIEILAKDYCLGIHYPGAGITAVLLRKDRHHAQRTAVYRVSCSKDNRQEELAGLMELLNEQLKADSRTKPPSALALGGSFYQSQFHHSEFSDARQIRQTLRFDVEEDFAANAENLALSFQYVPCPGPGADLIVHTLDREKIQELLPHFDRAGLDALRAEPDIAAWEHYLKDHPDLPGDEPLLAVAWTAGVLYTLVLDQDRQTVLARTYLCSTSAYAHEILAQELKRSLLQLPDNKQPRRLLYHSGSFTRDQINQLQRQFNLNFQPLEEPDAAVAFAAGAALSYFNSKSNADFRTDGLPPRTLVVAQHRALYGLSGAVCALFLALIIVFHAYTGHYLQESADAQQRLEQAYCDTNVGQKPPRGTNVVRRLRTQLNRLRSESRSRTSRMLPGSASHTLTLILQALDTLPFDFDLQFKSLTISEDTATIRGSVADLEQRVELDNAIRIHPQLQRGNWDFILVKQGDTTRRNFSASINVIKSETARDEDY